jgi:hypothetical protein
LVLSKATTRSVHVVPSHDFVFADLPMPSRLAREDNSMLSPEDNSRINRLGEAFGLDIDVALL